MTPFPPEWPRTDSSSRMWDNPKVLLGHKVSLVPSAVLEYSGEEKKQVPICISSKFALSQKAVGHFAS